MKELKVRLYGIITLMIFVAIFIFGVLIHDVRSAINIVGVSLMFAIIYWESSRWVVFRACNKIPGFDLTNQRIILILRYILPFAMLLPFFQMKLLEVFEVIYFSVFKVWNYLFYFGLNLITLSVVVVLYESIYYIRNWKLTLAESDSIKKINLKNQNQFLKEQIKPHFLFNCLNTLAALIHSEPDKAEEYVLEMSSVYRYLLSKKEVELAILQDELDFLNSYILMLKMRFADSLKIEIHLNLNAQNYLIPPFVLQLLLENAVKHNVVAKEFPLNVVIKFNGESLVISNPIRPKPIPDPSEKTGLMNLISRYKLLNLEEELLIINDNVNFTVILPLVSISKK